MPAFSHGNFFLPSAGIALCLPGKSQLFHFASCLIFFLPDICCPSSAKLHLFSVPSLLQPEAEIRNRCPVTPSEKKNFLSLLYCPDRLRGLQRLDWPRCRTTLQLLEH